MVESSTSTLAEVQPIGRPRPPATRAQTAQRAVAAAREHLLGLQRVRGEWCAELEGDTILESEYVLTMWFLGRQGLPRVAKAVECLRRQQGPDGGWPTYPGGPADVSVSVKAYFALKLSGDDPGEAHMVQARAVILAGGGVDACNSYTKITLAIFGQYDWGRCPAIPPELVLFPAWFPFNLYEMSSWARAIVVPLSIIWALKPRCPVPEDAGIGELFAARIQQPIGIRRFIAHRNVWTFFFATADYALKVLERWPWKPFRRIALRRAEAWTRKRLVKSDGVGAIFPPIVNTIIALRALGLPEDDAAVAGQIQELERLGIEEHDTLRVQPCFSALWDTAQVLNALLAAGVPPDDPDLLRGARWILDHEVKAKGDWAVKVKDKRVEPGGWYFEYANEWYPDCDDTAAVLFVLARLRFPAAADERLRREAVARGLAWLRAMQNPDGGWAAFDRACTKRFLTHVPFADHNAMLDPSCADITARVLESMDALGYGRGDRAVRRALRFLHAQQEDDGTWYGRWGANYLYGTWLALTGMTAVGEDTHAPRVRQAAAWLRIRQNPDGGWGETLASYDDPTLKGQGESTAAQTAWALLGLFAAGDLESPSVLRGIDHLLATQRPDGSWYDRAWTGTGFPRVFYLRYHLYATQFPLLALATWRDRLEAAAS